MFARQSGYGQNDTVCRHKFGIRATTGCRAELRFPAISNQIAPLDLLGSYERAKPMTI
jgi:hypothetical protein